MSQKSCACLVAMIAFMAVSHGAKAADVTVGPNDDAVAVITAAESGDTITFPEGTWALSGTATVGAGVTVKGAGVGKTIFTGGERHEWCLVISGEGADVSGFTLQDVTWDRDSSTYDRKKKGYAVNMSNGTLHDVRITSVNITATYFSYGTALCLTGGTVTGVTIDNCVGAKGSCYGTVYQDGGAISRCTFYDNTSKENGGALYLKSGTCDGCTFYGNIASGASGKGGGAYVAGGSLTQATFYGNGAGSDLYTVTKIQGDDVSSNRGAKGGGFYHTAGTIANCIAWGNTAPWQARGTVQEYVTTKAKNITNLCTDNPQFVDAANADFALKASSPAILADGTTLGAVAYDTTKTDAAMAISTTRAYPDTDVTFTATARNVASPAYAWQVTDASGATVATSSDAAFTTTLPVGIYSVTLQVTDGATPVVTETRAACLRIVSRAVTVTEQTTDALVDALENTLDGQTITFGAGTWALPSSVLWVRDGVKIVGAGTNATFFVGGSRAQACFNVLNANAEMSGFTLQDVTWNADNRLPSSGAINMSQGWLHDINVRDINCNATGNMYGLGCYMTNGRLSDMIFDNCHGSRTDMVMNGSGVYQSGGTTERLIIRNCSGKTYGGLYLTSGVCSNAVIHGNIARSSSAKGGGVYMTGGTLAHATLYKNEAATVPANQTGAMGGGLYHKGGIVTNCIVWASVAPSQTATGAPNWYSEKGAADQAKMIFNLCSTPALGTGAITNDPQFVDADAGNFAVKSSSSCLLADQTTVGAIPYDFSQADAAMTVTPTSAFEGEDIAFSATVQGVTAPTYAWTVTQTGAETPSFTSTEAGFVHGFDAGIYDVKLVVGNGTKDVATDERLGYLTIHARTNWVEAGVENALADAVENGCDGQTLIVGEGTHVVTRSVTINSALTLVGAGADKTTIEKSGTSGRVFTLNNAAASITGMTITGGRLPDDERDSWGAGVWIGDKGGTLTWCTITDNKTASGHFMRGGGVGMTGDGFVSHCIIRGNSVQHLQQDYGGGVALKAGILENCLIEGNTAIYGGGVAIAGTGKVRNCTIVGNTGTALGGGIYWWDADATAAQVQNCVFSGNVADADATKGHPNWSPSVLKDKTAYDYSGCEQAFAYCGFEGSAIVGTNSVTLVAPFEDAANGDYRLLLSAAGVNAGTNYTDMAAVDLNGNPRVIGPAVDMGAYETDTEKFGVSFAFDKTAMLQGVAVTATATVTGSSAFDCAWTVVGPSGATVKTAEGLAWTESFTDEGTYRVTLVVQDRTEAAKRGEAEGAFYVGPRIVELAEGASIHDALARALDGTEIRLAAGVYSVTNRVTVDKGVTIVGPGYKRCTVRRGYRDTSDNVSDSRVFYLNHADAVVRGVTVSEGILGWQGKNGGRNECGAGVCIAANGGTLEDCRVTGCASDTYYVRGAGVGVVGAKGVVRNCVIDHNSNVHANLPEECGGGVYMTAGVMSNCVIWANTSEYGGGVAFGGPATFANCTVVSNAARHVAGGFFHFQGDVKNLTIADSIFWGNADAGEKGTGRPEWGYRDTKGDAPTCTYCAFPEGVALPAGDTSFNCDPQFRGWDAERGCFKRPDFRIFVDSPCANASSTGSYVGALPPTPYNGLSILLR